MTSSSPEAVDRAAASPPAATRAMTQAGRSAISGLARTMMSRSTYSSLALPVAGLMSTCELTEVVASLRGLKEGISALGAERDILMGLHFIQLAVIPEIKITDQGLIDVLRQQRLPLFIT